MTQEQNKMREAFEEWVKPKAVELHGHINEWTKQWQYAHSHVDAMWQGYQAAYEHAQKTVGDEHKELIEKAMACVEGRNNIMQNDIKIQNLIIELVEALNSAANGEGV